MNNKVYFRNLVVIGTFLVLLGIPSIVTGILWLIQKVTGKLGGQGRYLRRQVFGLLVVIVSGLYGIAFAVLLFYARSKASDLPDNAGATFARASYRIFFPIFLLWSAGLRSEDGFLRALFVPYSSLSPDAKKRLLSGKREE
jgi:hypothetical protein